MTIFKHQQRDEYTALDWFRGFLGAVCPSHITLPGGTQIKHVCSSERGHDKAHHDQRTGLKWGYGDDKF